ncbi:hypothetical protein TIFTF001_010223 [Ficus carica]|uniref:Transmembrane protein n=1 Tax=Ficus carica TaxID=3494 RepID=A0AA87ZWP1_FICCA|nr:hypothetical protein TIFTF001_010223 [Ficus carica]
MARKKLSFAWEILLIMFMLMLLLATAATSRNPCAKSTDGVHPDDNPRCGNWRTNIHY